MDSGHANGAFRSQESSGESEGPRVEKLIFIATGHPVADLFAVSNFSAIFRSNNFFRRF